MAIFGIQTQKNEDVRKFMAESNNRLNSENFVKNPFTGKIKLIKEKDGLDSWLVVMTPIYPHFYIAGLFLLLGVAFWKHTLLTWWSLPGSLIFLLGIFYLPIFYSFVLRKGLKKIGYEGKAKQISKSDIIMMMIE